MMKDHMLGYVESLPKLGAKIESPKVEILHWSKAYLELSETERLALDKVTPQVKKLGHGWKLFTGQELPENTWVQGALKLNNKLEIPPLPLVFKHINKDVLVYFREITAQNERLPLCGKEENQFFEMPEDSSCPVELGVRISFVNEKGKNESCGDVALGWALDNCPGMFHQLRKFYKLELPKEGDRERIAFVLKARKMT